ncbi:MAG: hypothetical protein ACOYBE_00365 [Blautia sp.]|jgi:hypothetical protein
MDNLRQTYEVFTECWRAYKKLYPGRSLNDEDYWKQVVIVLSDVRERHPTKFCEEILGTIKNELERMAG